MTKPKKPVSPKMLAALEKARAARKLNKESAAPAGVADCGVGTAPSAVGPVGIVGQMGPDDSGLNAPSGEPGTAGAAVVTNLGKTGIRKLVERCAGRINPVPVQNVCYFTGDLGDVLAALPVVRAMGGARLVFGPPPSGDGTGTGPGFCRESLAGGRYEALKPLLEVQPYVFGVSWSDAGLPAAGPGEKVVDFSGFRLIAPIAGENLISWQARAVGWYNVDSRPWLTVDGNGWVGGGPAVFARSPRYWNLRMPWTAILEKHPDGVFVGTQGEHHRFSESVKKDVRWLATGDLLELARVIARCERFFGNQSCPHWVAMGLGAPGVLEMCVDEKVQNSIVERENTRFIGNEGQRGRGRNWL